MCLVKKITNFLNLIGQQQALFDSSMSDIIPFFHRPRRRQVIFTIHKINYNRVDVSFCRPLSPVQRTMCFQYAVIQSDFPRILPRRSSASSSAAPSAHLSVLSACLPCSQFVAVRNNMADILTISHFLALLGPTSASAKCNSHLRPYMSCLMQISRQVQMCKKEKGWQRLFTKVTLN